MAKKNSHKNTGSTIALNKRAKFDYHLSDRFEAGVALLGWEVKSLRAGKVQLTEATSSLKMTKLGCWGRKSTLCKPCLPIT